MLKVSLLSRCKKKKISELRWVAYGTLSRGCHTRFQHLVVAVLFFILQQKHCKQMSVTRHVPCSLLAHLLLIPSAQWGAVTERNRSNTLKIFQMKHEPALFPSDLAKEIL